jgi:hypothetical protein
MTGPPTSRSCPCRVLLVFADNDSVSQKHIAEFFALLGGGVKEPGWLNTQLSKSRLAVVPGGGERGCTGGCTPNGAETAN